MSSKKGNKKRGSNPSTRVPFGDEERCRDATAFSSVLFLLLSKSCRFVCFCVCLFLCVSVSRSSGGCCSRLFRPLSPPCVRKKHIWCRFSKAPLSPPLRSRSSFLVRGRFCADIGDPHRRLIYCVFDHRSQFDFPPNTNTKSQLRNRDVDRAALFVVLSRHSAVDVVATTETQSVGQ